jgi:hypothetical protein
MKLVNRLRWWRARRAADGEVLLRKALSALEPGTTVREKLDVRTRIELELGSKR